MQFQSVSILDGTSDGVVAPIPPDASVPPCVNTQDFAPIPPDFSKPPPLIEPIKVDPIKTPSTRSDFAIFLLHFLIIFIRHTLTETLNLLTLR